MINRDEQSQIELEGRVLALELIMRSVLPALFNGREDPVGDFDGYERLFLSELQKLERPLTEKSDAVWDAAVPAIELMFTSVRGRLLSGGRDH